MFNRHQYQQSLTEQQQPLTRSQQFLYESMKRGTFEDFADRTKPLRLPAGVSLESFINDLGDLYFNKLWEGQ